jgi:hypothetical protein
METRRILLEGREAEFVELCLSVEGSFQFARRIGQRIARASIMTLAFVGELAVSLVLEKEQAISTCSHDDCCLMECELAPDLLGSWTMSRARRELYSLVTRGLRWLGREPLQTTNWRDSRAEKQEIASRYSFPPSKNFNASQR